MKKIILNVFLIFFLIFSTSYQKNEISSQELKNKEILEITQNIYISNKNLNDIAIIINNDKKLKKLEHNLKNK